MGGWDSDRITKKTPPQTRELRANFGCFIERAQIVIILTYCIDLDVKPKASRHSHKQTRCANTAKQACVLFCPKSAEGGVRKQERPRLADGWESQHSVCSSNILPLALLCSKPESGKIFRKNCAE